jgi:hypothetical protein
MKKHLKWFMNVQVFSPLETRNCFFERWTGWKILREKNSSKFAKKWENVFSHFTQKFSASIAYQQNGVTASRCHGVVASRGRDKSKIWPWVGVKSWWYKCCKRVVYIVVSSPPASEETEDMGREIESRQDLHKVVALKNAARGLPNNQE